MKDCLVIVGFSRIDAESEQCAVSSNDQGIWSFRVPQDAAQLTEQAVVNLDSKVRALVHTLISCNFTYDSYARSRSMLNDRVRPSDVLATLGVSFDRIMSSQLPSLKNSFKVDATCAAGLVALDLASMIANTHNAVVLIAGVDKSTAPKILKMFDTLGAVAALPNQYYVPFDQRRAGFAMGECAAMLAVTTASTAKANKLDVLAVVDTVNVQTIFSHPTAPSDPALAQKFIAATLTNSHRRASEFACWDAHATATPQGDQIEYDIFSQCFPDADIAISSFKSRVGHCMAVSALVETINAIQQLQKNYISPNFALEQPLASDARLITECVLTQKKTFIKTSFGFGGKNAAAVITVQ